MTEPVQICRGFTDEQWRGLRKGLDDNDESAWSCAIEIFERRISERFLSCIDVLMNADSKLDVTVASGTPADCSTLPHDAGRPVVVPGFAILALCCLLAETLQSFRASPAQAPNQTGPCTFPAGRCIKPTTTDQFMTFLSRPAFNDAFKDGKVAKQFVQGVRNGILHEAETRRWVIWRDEPAGHIVEQLSPKRYAVNRGEFFRALKREFEDYVKELGDPANAQLRARFLKKMDDVTKQC